MKKLSTAKKKLPSAQPTTPTASTASAQTLHPGNSAATEETCVAATQLPMPNFTGQVAAPVDINVAAATTLDDDGLDQLISAKVANIRSHHNKVRGHRAAEKTGWRDLLPMLDEMQRRLTRRGARFGETFTSYLRGKGLNPNTVRSWRRRLKMESPATAEPVETNEESTDTPSNYDWQDQREGISTPAELLMQWANRLEEVLTKQSTLSGDQRIKRAMSMVRDLKQAISEGMLVPAPPAPEQPVSDSYRFPAQVAPAPRASATPAFHPTTGANEPHRATQTLPCSRSTTVPPVKVTSGPARNDAEGEGRGDRVLPDATDYVPSAITRAGYARTESGKWEFVGFPDNEPFETNAVDGDHRGYGRV